jgi:Tfp pilus assembly protein PilV
MIMFSMSKTRSDQKRTQTARGRRAAFTLVEVMVGTFVMTIALVGLFGTGLKAYQINHQARVRDQARAVLRSMADQFLFLDQFSNGGQQRTLFTVTGEAAESGAGLRWGQLANDIIGANLNLPSVQIQLGDANNPVNARLSKSVAYVHVARDTAFWGTTGVHPNNVFQPDDNFTSGYTIQATFVIRYNLENREITQHISVNKYIAR